MDSQHIFVVMEQMAVLRRFQKSLNTLTGLSFDFLNIHARHAPVLHAAKAFAPFCRLVHRNPSGRNACEACTGNMIKQCWKKHRTVIGACHLGLVDVYVPVIIQGAVIGFFSTGQFLLRSPARSQFGGIRSKLVQLGVDIEQANKAYLNLVVFSRKKLTAVINLIHILVDMVVAEEPKLQAIHKAAKEDRIVQARQFVDSHYMDPISLTDVSAAVHISPSRLSHAFTQSMGYTLTAYLHDVRLFWAKYFLVNTGLRIIEIAGRAGFDNISHFNHLFKEKEGVSPRQFRRQYRDHRS